MRWACLLLPCLSLDGVLRQCPDPDTALVLASGPRQRRIVHALTPQARAMGVKRGMPLSTAQAVVPGLHVFEHDPRRDAALHERLAAWAYAFSSQVSHQFPHALLLEIAGSRALFGQWPALSRRLGQELDGLGLRWRMAAAPNPYAAWALAMNHRHIGVDDSRLEQALGQLPVARCGLPAAVVQTLQRSGLKQLRQVWAIARSSLVRRFPKAAIDHLDALRGVHAPPLAYYLPPERFHARIEFEYDVESTQALLFPLRRLTADLAAFLQARDGGAQRFALVFEHEPHPDRPRPDTRLDIGLLAPEREAGMLFELARSRLDKLRLPAPARAMRLLAEHLPPFVPEGRDLFDARPQQTLPWPQLRERLRARLGDDAVQPVLLHADHRPERATVVVSSGRRSAEEQRSTTRSSAPPRPAWLLQRPIPLRGHGITVLAGPERIESGWWDGADMRRDYLIVRTRDGQHAWAFRPWGSEALWLQGWFA
ncbi:MAG: DNA polymerase Y family protein [Pseudoxanthomonas suwonensis]|nr:DNA polymerase Y family protein [Pseudoxanthomonas suwonensis]